MTGPPSGPDHEPVLLALHRRRYTVVTHHERGTIMAQVKKFAPFLTARWWILHTVAIAAVYAAGHLLMGG